VEKPLAEEEKAELKELTYRFDRFAKKKRGERIAL
jgi:hypothetical protein